MLPVYGCGSDFAICRLVAGDSSVRAWIFRKFHMEAFSYVYATSRITSLIEERIQAMKDKHMPAHLGTSPQEYAHLGLKQGQIEQWEDGMRTDGSPNTYEWW